MKKGGYKKLIQLTKNAFLIPYLILVLNQAIYIYYILRRH